MPPIILTLLQGLFLLLLYIFVWRVFRTVLRDTEAVSSYATRRAAAPARAAPKPQPRRTKRAAAGQLVVHLPTGRPQVIPLRDGDVVFGRNGADVVLDDPYVSERHARVYRDGDEWLLTDLGSTNGTFLNQMKVTSPATIAAGDQFAIGKTTVEVRK